MSESPFWLDDLPALVESPPEIPSPSNPFKIRGLKNVQVSLTLKSGIPDPHEARGRLWDLLLMTNKEFTIDEESENDDYTYGYS